MLKTKKQAKLDEKAPKNAAEGAVNEKPNYSMYFIWLVLLIFAFYIEFFMPTLLIFILFIVYKFTSTNTVKDENYKSGYSVFNKNFERIEGDRDPDSVDKELRNKSFI